MRDSSERDPQLLDTRIYTRAGCYRVCFWDTRRNACNDVRKMTPTACPLSARSLSHGVKCIIRNVDPVRTIFLTRCLMKACRCRGELNLADTIDYRPWPWPFCPVPTMSTLIACDGLLTEAPERPASDSGGQYHGDRLPAASKRTFSCRRGVLSET